jgi:hypothetical protein
MIPKLSYVYACLSLFVIGCANKNKSSADEVSSVPTTLAQRLSEGGGFKQDADGNWVPKSNKRSSFELERDSPYFKGNIEKEAYQTDDYKKKSWWGNKSYEAGEYKGATDGSRFKTEAKQQGKVAFLGNKKVQTGDPYKTNTLEYQGARESDADRLDKPRNDYTESRRRSYVQPSVIDWEEQRKLSLEQSRSILGR